MLTVYVHIGTHKTGTTTIQKFFSKEGRSNGDNIYYPKTGQIPSGSHHNLVWEAAKDGRFQTSCGTWDYLLSELAALPQESGKVLLSCEAFSAYADQEITIAPLRTLARKLGAKVQPLYFVRAQEAYLESLYIQEAKSGSITKDFDRYVEEKLVHPRFNYFSVAEAWSAAFEKTIVIPYEPQKEDFDSLRELLAALAEQDSFGVLKKTNKNERAALDDVGVILAITRAGRRSGLTKRQTEQMAAKLSKTLISRNAGRPAAGFLTRDEGAKIHAKFAESNAALAKKYLNRDSLFSELLPELPESNAGLEKDYLSGLEKAFFLAFHRGELPDGKT